MRRLGIRQSPPTIILSVSLIRPRTKSDHPRAPQPYAEEAIEIATPLADADSGGDELPTGSMLIAGALHAAYRSGPENAKTPPLSRRE